MNSLSMTQEHCNIHEWLLRVLGQVELAVKSGSVVVLLVEETGNDEWEVRRADTGIGSIGKIRNVGFVVGGVDVLSVPAALEVLDDKKMRQTV
jgi:hypothetical protein